MNESSSIDQTTTTEATEAAPVETAAAEAIPRAAAADPAIGSTEEATATRADEETLGDPAIFADPGADPDPHCDPVPATPPADRIDELRGEIARLREEMAAREAFRARLEEDYTDFHTLYPEIALASLSDAVWKQVQSGTPLAAAYALEERRQLLLQRRAQAANRQNRERSAGGFSESPNDHYSPAEVRAMSSTEIRKQMPLIMESMKKW